jgi:hypothetical protein
VTCTVRSRLVWARISRSIVATSSNRNAFNSVWSTSFVTRSDQPPVDDP